MRSRYKPFSRNVRFPYFAIFILPHFLIDFWSAIDSPWVSLPSLRKNASFPKLLIKPTWQSYIRLMMERTRVMENLVWSKRYLETSFSIIMQVLYHTVLKDGLRRTKIPSMNLLHLCLQRVRMPSSIYSSRITIQMVGALLCKLSIRLTALVFC